MSPSERMLSTIEIQCKTVSICSYSRPLESTDKSFIILIFIYLYKLL